MIKLTTKWVLRLRTVNVKYTTFPCQLWQLRPGLSLVDWRAVSVIIPCCNWTLHWVRSPADITVADAANPASGFLQHDWCACHMCVQLVKAPVRKTARWTRVTIYFRANIENRWRLKRCHRSIYIYMLHFSESLLLRVVIHASKREGPVPHKPSRADQTPVAAMFVLLLLSHYY